MEQVCIKRIVTIDCRDNQAPWLIHNLENIDGREFLKLSHRDVGFCRFIAGKNFKQISTMTFLHELQLKRAQMTLDACSNAAQGQALFDEAVPTVAAQKRARRDAKSRASLGALPPTISMQMPDITMEDGTHVPGVVLRAKSSLDVRESVMMELDAHMLSYARCAMLNSHSDRVTPDRRHPGVTWRSDRKHWSARRKTDNGRFATKSFKPDGDDELAMNEAADRAAAWADGHDDTIADETSEPLADTPPTLDEDDRDSSPAGAAAPIEDATPSGGGVRCDLSAVVSEMPRDTD